jgi:hypothetical protein
MRQRQYTLSRIDNCRGQRLALRREMLQDSTS